MTSIVVNKSSSKIIIVEESQPKVIVINKGPKGDSGSGFPPGGTIDQFLTKKSSVDYDAEWKTVAIGNLFSNNNLSDVDNVDTARENIKAITNTESIINALIFG